MTQLLLAISMFGLVLVGMLYARLCCNFVVEPSNRRSW
jgi:hypothetical protein